MNGIDYLQMINDLDDELVMAANQTPVKRRTPVRVWISMAAGVLVALGIGFMVNMTHPTTSDNIRQQHDGIYLPRVSLCGSRKGRL